MDSNQEENASVAAGTDHKPRLGQLEFAGSGTTVSRN